MNKNKTIHLILLSFSVCIATGCVERRTVVVDNPQPTAVVVEKPIGKSGTTETVVVEQQPRVVYEEPAIVEPAVVVAPPLFVGPAWGWHHRYYHRW